MVARRRFRVPFTIAGLLIGLVVTGALYEFALEQLDRRHGPPAGEFVLLPDGRRLHMLVVGQAHGAPTVILENGGGLTLDFWTKVQTRLGAAATAVSYDRAGEGWSDAVHTDRGASGVVDDLALALRVRRLPGPYVLVGHSIGGLYVRKFAERFPDQVAGVELVDPSVEGWRSLPKALAAGLEELQHQIGPWRWLVRIGVSRLWNPFAAAAVYLPAPQRADYLAATHRDAQLQSTERDGQRLLETGSGSPTLGSLGDIPVRIVSAGLGAGPRGRDLEHAQWRLQDGLLAISTRSSHRILPDANHISLITEEPFASSVADEILTLVRLARAPPAQASL